MISLFSLSPLGLTDVYSLASPATTLARPLANIVVTDSKREMCHVSRRRRNTRVRTALTYRVVASAPSSKRSPAVSIITRTQRSEFKVPALGFDEVLGFEWGVQWWV